MTVDFFCIGAPKCRTTWLANCLTDHPEVAVSRVKEPDFFVKELGVFRTHENPSFMRDWDWYRSLWDHAPVGAVKGDFSINLLNNAHTAPQAIKEHFPDARFVVSLRNPVRRTYSHYWHIWGRKRHWGGVPETFEEAIHDETLLWRSRYAAQLTPWFEHFPRDRFLVLLDFELNEDPLGQIGRVYRFLGVDDAFVPPSLDVRINGAKARKGRLERAIKVARRMRAMHLGFAVDAAKRLNVRRVLDRVDFEPFRYPPLAPETAEELRRMLRPDMKRLEQTLGRDLERWTKAPAARRRPLPPRAESRLTQRDGRRTRVQAVDAVHERQGDAFA
jgi:hypothetical protein